MESSLWSLARFIVALALVLGALYLMRAALRPRPQTALDRLGEAHGVKRHWLETDESYEARIRAAMNGR